MKNSLNNLNALKEKNKGQMTRFVLGLLLLIPTTVVMMAAPRDAQSNEEIKAASPNNAKSANDPVGVNMDENIRLRRDLDEYSRNVDPAHVQIEERRRVMRKRLQERFASCDRDDDGSLVLDEIYDCMPQIARRFGEVDLNGDRGITLEELEALQARMADRQKVIAIKADSAQDGDSTKRKNKDASGNVRKSAL
jgi:hypothetical protein